MGGLAHQGAAEVSTGHEPWARKGAKGTDGCFHNSNSLEDRMRLLAGQSAVYNIRTAHKAVPGDQYPAI